MVEYKEFVLTIHTKDAVGNYPLSARSREEGEAEGSMRLTAEDLALNDLLKNTSLPMTPGATLKNVGNMLFQRIFPEKIQKLYERCLMSAQPLRIRLIVHPPELVWL
ncbi:hypothetical protein U14_00437 [Candidatus Moduliflexus flocculans]|uniref:Uncharacterized protein n=1 Tax=Candidatus Moduliflexus flocculans TaxID=1499966 RepID=A0A0S6VVE5_9BACT|nr:hypothetical protein U14_00437 [Candidatus Moduliflexus flocculans]